MQNGKQKHGTQTHKHRKEKQEKLGGETKTQTNTT